MKRIFIGFDGSCLCTETSKDGHKIAKKAKLKKVEEFGQGLTRIYPEVVPIILVDHTIMKIIDDYKWLKEQLDTWQIFKIEKGKEADIYLLQLLEVAPFHALIVSRDKFREHISKVPAYYSNFEWRFDSYFSKSELKIPGLIYQIEKILELDNLGTYGINGSVSKKLIEEYLGGI